MDTARRDEKRNLETIPVGSLGLIPLAGCRHMGEEVDRYLTKWRSERESEHKDSLAFAGYERPTYIVEGDVPRFGNGEAKGVLKESVRGMDLYIMVDVCNYSMTYSLYGETNHMSPDDHFQNLKRIIAAVGGKARRITVIMPFLLTVPSPCRSWSAWALTTSSPLTHMIPAYRMRSRSPASRQSSPFISSSRAFSGM